MKHIGEIFLFVLILFCLLGTSSSIHGQQWDGPASELGRKITTRVGLPATGTLAVRNSSAIGNDEVDEITRALQSDLRRQGIQLGGKGQSQVKILVTLSENARGYLWIAEIQTEASRDVVMLPVELPKTETPPDATMVTLQRTRLLESGLPILDVLPFESAPDKPQLLVVLYPNELAAQELVGTAGTGQAAAPKSTFSIPHSRPWPRDPRGRLVRRGERSFDAYLPGVACSGSIETDLKIECRENEDWWPLVSDSAAASAQFISDRNYFNGRVKLKTGEELPLPPFFSGALVTGKSPVWIVAGLDGKTQLFRNDLQLIASWHGWGTEIAAIESRCGSGTQVLSNSGEGSSEADFIRAYEISSRGAVPTSEPLKFGGTVTALWPASGSSAIAISHDRASDRYEAFVISIACPQ